MKTIAEIVNKVNTEEISFYVKDNFTPKTSWEEIVAYAADRFVAYASDEVSTDENGKTIADRYGDGNLTEENIVDEFKEFCSWRWADEFDID